MKLSAIYKEPITEVYQTYTGSEGIAVSAELPVCIIGPANQNVEEVEVGLYDTALATEDGYTPVYTTPDLLPGVTPTVEQTTITVENPEVFLPVANTGTAVDIPAGNTAYNNRVRIAHTDGNVIPIVGDKIDITITTMPAGSVEGSTPTITTKLGVVITNVIQEIATGGALASCELTVNKALFLNTDTIPIDSTPFTAIKLYRVIDETLIKPTDLDYELKYLVGGTQFSLSNLSISYTIGEVLYPILVVRKALIFTSYNGIITNKGNTIYTARSIEDIAKDIGEATPANPLAYAVRLALLNSSTEVKYIGITEDTADGYFAALDVLKRGEAVYAIVPLTQDKSILSSYMAHVREATAPEKNRWCVLIATTTPQPKQTVIDYNPLLTGTFSTTDPDSGVPLVQGMVAFISETANFMFNGIIAGDTLRVKSDENVETALEIFSVPSEEYVLIRKADISAEVYNFAVDRNLTKMQQAEAIAAESSSIKYERYWNIFAGSLIIGNDIVDSFYFAAIIGGAVAGLPPQQGFTKITFAGVSGVTGTWDQFDSEELNVMAGGGTAIITQDNASSLPYMRHQLTTDQSNKETSEMSIIKNKDYVAMILSAGLNSRIGTYNLVEDTIEAIKITVTNKLSSLSRDVLPKIGAPVTSYRSVTVTEDANARDTVWIYVDFKVPYALNFIKLVLTSIK